MHEFSICQSLVTAVVEELGKLKPKSCRLVKSRVMVGGLRQVVPEYLQDAYKLLAKDTAAEGSELEVIQAPIVGKCGDCSWQGELSAGNFSCRGCGSGNMELTGGMELHLDGLEVETDD